MENSRRRFLKVFGSGVASVYLSGCSTRPLQKTLASFKQARVDESIQRWGPIDRTDAPLKGEFAGDRFTRPHSVFWRKAQFVAALPRGMPRPSRSAEVVVVGGGMSGLISTYFSRHQRPVLMEQAVRMGGNSKGESWKGLDYGIGAAYTTVPEPQSEIARFWQEIGVDQLGRKWEGSDSLFVKGRFYQDFWEKGTVGGTRKQFRLLRKHFSDILEGRNGLKYPNLPAQTSEERELVNRLDHESFHSYLRRVVGGNLHPHVEEVIESYFWTAFGASAVEVSAAAGISFFVGDLDSHMVFPGGNACIAEGVYRKLVQELPAENLMTSTLVFDVKVNPEGVVVSYLKENGEVDAIFAKKVVLACPKFVVRHLIDDLEPERLDAIRALKYRSYLVANVLVDQPLDDIFYDLYFFDGKARPLRKSDVQVSATRQKVTDLCYGNFTQPNPRRSILTLSRAFPYDEGRSELYREGSFDRYRAEFEKQIQKDIFPLLKISSKNWVDLRMARWGHPLPVPEVGVYAQKRVDALRAPFKDRVFFAEQDNWALPCFETAYYEAKNGFLEMQKRS